MSNKYSKSYYTKNKIGVTVFVVISIIMISLTACSKKENNKENTKISTTKIQTTQSAKYEEETSQPAKEKQVIENNYNYSESVPINTKVDNSYFDDAVFIGDSRTEGFMLYSGLSNATYYTHKGLMVNTAFTSPAINLNGKRVSVMDALQQNKKYKKVYIMLGINELGWSYSNLFIEKYGVILDTIKQNNSDTKIFIQSLIPVTASKSKSDKIYNNKKIQEYNTLLQKLALDKKVYYVNVAETLKDSNGCLPEDAAYDGVHLKKTYCQKWLNYLKTHTV